MFERPAPQAMGYPESLMVLFTALAVYLALRGMHIWAGVALGVGVLARHLSFFAGGSLLVAQVNLDHSRGSLGRVRAPLW
jgi:hypothetical protein